MTIIDGKQTALEIKTEIANEVRKMLDKKMKAPHLAAIIVGDDPASHTYVRNKEKACKDAGFMSTVYKHPANTSENELLEIIDFLNNDNDIDGFIVQVPLPGHINVDKVLQRIDPKKDVDGFHPVNLGRMMIGLPAYISATPKGIIELIRRYKIETSGKRAVVLGRSNIVGTPVSLLLSRKANPGNATVTLCHSQTENLAGICRSADILIAAIGKKEFVTEEMVKKDAVIIDVGIHRVPSEKTKSGFKLVGDVKFDEVSRKCSYITPVPGGVGPMTIVGLLMNTLKASRKEIYTI